jgi:hypothetical protein
MSTQYKNLNQFPVIVPSKRGSSFTILPGSYQSDPWFSRFCGMKQLTRIVVSDDGNYSPDASKPVVPTTPFEELLGDVQQESMYYRQVSDIYQCKKCDVYRTGSKEALKRHLKTAHLMDVKDVDYNGEEPKEVVPAPKAPAAPKLPADPNPPEMTPETKAKISEAAKAAAKKMGEAIKAAAPVVHHCDICDRNFKSAAGLKTHKTMKHKESNG